MSSDNRFPIERKVSQLAILVGLSFLSHSHGQVVARIQISQRKMSSGAVNFFLYSVKGKKAMNINSGGEGSMLLEYTQMH